MQHHFCSASKAYLPEPVPDDPALYEGVCRLLGRPAWVASYEREIDLSRLIGLEGAYCAYLERRVHSPVERKAYAVIGNTDSYRLYLNGELVGEADESVWWTPFNQVHPITLRQGANRFVLKLLRPREGFRFTMGLRAADGPRGGAFNASDWLVDLADVLDWPLDP